MKKVLKRQSRLQIQESTSCIVVGNSRNLLDSGKGENIDSCDCVIRINTAPTRSYEEDVGSKTTARIINTAIQRGDSVEYSPTTTKNWLKGKQGHFILKPSRNPDFAESAANLAHAEAELYYLTEKWQDKFYDDLKDRFYKSQPSTGLFAVWLAKALFKDVSAIGFDFYQSEYIHYYEDTKKEENPDAHQWKSEMSEFIRILKQ